ncbi:hypothetical protein IW261DRAFT_1576190 [Armillaria novae-zelandiae]|uniref:Uncharacterized protein n=1 Tax=Armillaria novae-zelandiae TaxID=153914 RepID=A0AA39TT26_9AGAR|nr:hypothetical protein IW261DRAFT_1576190 [Armillaria novae-zelandiae]
MADDLQSYSLSHVMHSPIPVSKMNVTNWTSLLDSSCQPTLSYSHPPIEYQTPPSHQYQMPWSPPSRPTTPNLDRTILNGHTELPTTSILTAGRGLDTSLPSAPTIIKPVVIDRLAKDFELAEPQRKHLHLFTELARLQGGLTMPDVMTCLFTLVIQFSLHNRCFEGDGNAATMAELLEDLKMQLNKCFDFTKDQRDNIRYIIWDVMYNAKRTAYHDIEPEVFTVLLKEKDTIGLKNVFGVPSREHLLRSEIHMISSSIRDSLKKSLVEFTAEMNKKYRRSGSSTNYHLTTARNSVFRRFVAEHQDLVWALEDPHLEDENTVCHSVQPPKKRRKLPSGRSAKGEDFWSQLDKYFNVRIVLYQGDNLLSERWKPFIDQTLAYDQSGFKFLPIIPVSSPCDGADDADLTGSAGSGARDLMALLN